MSYIALAAGGTAGHVNPALALAEELLTRGHHVKFYGTLHGMEADLVKSAGIEFEGLDISGFDRAKPHTAITAVMKLERAKKQLIHEFQEEGIPDAAVGFGAYVELPLAQAIAHFHKPLILHEQNSVPGMANKMAARHADVIALTYPLTKDYFAKHAKSQAHMEVCGNPVRASVMSASREESRKELGIKDSECLLLVFGGSLGAQHINEAVTRLKADLLACKDLVIIHAAGKRDFERTQQSLDLTAEEAKRWRLLPYIDNMGVCLAAADCAVSRAGASSIAELAACCVPALLVPYPYATANHQMTNAAFLVDTGGARVIEDAKLDDPVFREDVLKLIQDAPLRDSMRLGLMKLAAGKAQARLADAIENVL